MHFGERHTQAKNQHINRRCLTQERPFGKLRFFTARIAKTVQPDVKRHVANKNIYCTNPQK